MKNLNNNNFHVKSSDKIISVFGDSGVGKSSLIQCFISGKPQAAVPLTPGKLESRRFQTNLPLSVYSLTNEKDDELDESDSNSKLTKNELKISDLQRKKPNFIIVDTMFDENNPNAGSEIMQDLNESHLNILMFAYNDVESYNRLKSYWMPISIRYCPNTPIIIVGSKVDLATEEHFNQFDTKPFMDILQVEMCIDCSAYIPMHIDKVFYYSQKIILVPHMPIYNSLEHSLTESATKALTNIFESCDTNNDGYIHLNELSSIVEDMCGELVADNELVWYFGVLSSLYPLAIMNETSLSLMGFLKLHILFIQRGKIINTWKVLKRWNQYNNILPKKTSIFENILTVDTVLDAINSVHGVDLKAKLEAMIFEREVNGNLNTRSMVEVIILTLKEFSITSTTNNDDDRISRLEAMKNLIEKTLGINPMEILQLQNRRLMERKRRNVDIVFDPVIEMIDQLADSIESSTHRLQVGANQLKSFVKRIQVLRLKELRSAEKIRKGDKSVVVKKKNRERTASTISRGSTGEFASFGVGGDSTRMKSLNSKDIDRAKHLKSETGLTLSDNYEAVIKTATPDKVFGADAVRAQMEEMMKEEQEDLDIGHDSDHSDDETTARLLFSEELQTIVRDAGAVESSLTGADNVLAMGLKLVRLCCLLLQQLHEVSMNQVNLMAEKDILTEKIAHLEDQIVVLESNQRKRSNSIASSSSHTSPEERIAAMKKQAKKGKRRSFLGFGKSTKSEISLPISDPLPPKPR